MKFGKKIILVNSLIIAFLTAVIVVAAAVAGTRVLRSNTRNALIDTVSARASVISAGGGVVPSDFDYDVGDVYLSVYLSDGTLKNGSFPAKIDLPIQKGVVSAVRVDGKQYYVYDFAISLEGRNDIYLRGIVEASYDVWFVAIISFTVLAVALAAASIVLNIISVRRAVKPIDVMRKEVIEITETGDISKRLSKVTSDLELARLADDYNFMLDRLEEMFRNHERFTSDVAHELRTPLTVILSESEYALKDTENTDDKDESLAVIRRQSERLKAITDSLLEFTRFANRISIDLSPIDLGAVTEDFLDDYPLPDGVTLQREIEHGVTVPAEITLYERVLQNLLDNAVKYGKPNGTIFVTIEKTDSGARLSVRDDGIGMSEETLKHVFDRFYRADPSRSDKKGLGLGLSLVKEIVRLFGAEISMRSALGQGTCVLVTFPHLQTETV